MQFRGKGKYSKMVSCFTRIPGASSRPLLHSRAITSKSLSFFTREHPELFERHDPRYGAALGEGARYDPASWRTLFHLATNRDSWDGPNNLFKVFTACFMLRCLREAREGEKRKGGVPDGPNCIELAWRPF